MTNWDTQSCSLRSKRKGIIPLEKAKKAILDRIISKNRKLCAANQPVNLPPEQKIMCVIRPYLDSEGETGIERRVTAVRCNHCHFVRALNLEIKRPRCHQSVASQLKGVGPW